MAFTAKVSPHSTDLVAEISKLAQRSWNASLSHLFRGQLVFPRETFLTRFLHNYAVFAASGNFINEAAAAASAIRV